jgi:hypothetical protein
MTEHSVVQLISLAIIAATAILIHVVSRIYAVSRAYVDGCSQIAAATTVYEHRQTITQILTNTSTGRFRISAAYSTTPTSESAL